MALHSQPFTQIALGSRQGSHDSDAAHTTMGTCWTGRRVLAIFLAFLIKRRNVSAPTNQITHALKQICVRTAVVVVVVVTCEIFVESFAVVSK